MSASKRPSTSSLRRYLTSRPFVSVADIRRRFALEADAMSRVSRNGTSAYIGLPEREAAKLEDLWRGDEVGVELSVEVNAPVVIGVYPLRLARFVTEPHALDGNGRPNGYAHHAPTASTTPTASTAPTTPTASTAPTTPTASTAPTAHGDPPAR